MNRFFIDGKKIRSGSIILEGDDVVHVHRVLRLKKGDKLELCDGEGTDYIARIDSIEKNLIQASILEDYPSQGEPDIKITLYQAIPKGSKMETIIQKSVELGINRIVPVNTVRTVVRLETGKDQEKKVERWQRIAEEAAKQSGRGLIPEILMPLPFEEAVKSDHDLKIILWEGEREKSLKSVLDNLNGKTETAALFIGPEGGLEKEEVLQAVEHGWHSVALGPRILRTETAGMTVLSIMMFHMEEMEWKQDGKKV